MQKYQRNSFPFRRKAGMGLGSNMMGDPTPILTFPLKGKEPSGDRKWN
jgi:hypothetical protein